MTRHGSRYDLYRYCITLQDKKVDKITSLINWELRSVQEDLATCRVAPALKEAAEEYRRDLNLLQIILHNGAIPDRCSPRFLNSVSAVLDRHSIRFNDFRASFVLSVSGGTIEDETKSIISFLQDLLGSTLTARYFFQSVDLIIPSDATTGTQAETRLREILRELDQHFTFWLFFMTQKNHNLRLLLGCISGNGTLKSSAYRGDPLMVMLQERWLPAMHWMCCYARFSESDVREFFNQTLDYLYPPNARTPFTVKVVEKLVPGQRRYRVPDR